MPRENVRDWDPQDRWDLIELTLRWLALPSNSSILPSHNLMIHGYSGAEFFNWHRRFLQLFERFLQNNTENLPGPATIGPQPITGYVALPVTSRPRDQRPARMVQDRNLVLAGRMGVVEEIKRAGPIRPPHSGHAGQQEERPVYQAQEPAPDQSVRRRNFGRLPKWVPWEPIPQEFLDDPERGHPAAVLGNVHTPADQSSIQTSFGPWMPDVINGWNNVNPMGLTLEWGPTMVPFNRTFLGPHFKVHLACGGDMGDPTLVDAPKAPIFWPWHAFIDDIYQSWLDGGHSATSDFWEGTPGTRGLTGVVPVCEGLPLDVARHQIGHNGLVVGLEYRLDVRYPFVRKQRPLPGTQLTPGEGRVDLSGTNDFPTPTVPQCVFWPAAIPLHEARRRIRDAGLNVGWEEDFRGDGDVVKRQRPEGGAQINPFANVHLGARSNSIFPDEPGYRG